MEILSEKTNSVNTNWKPLLGCSGTLLSPVTVTAVSTPMATGGFRECDPSVPSLPAAMGVFQVAVPALLQASSLPEAAVRS